MQNSPKGEPSALSSGFLKQSAISWRVKTKRALSEVLVVPAAAASCVSLLGLVHVWLRWALLVPALLCCEVQLEWQCRRGCVCPHCSYCTAKSSSSAYTPDKGSCGLMLSSVRLSTTSLLRDHSMACSCVQADVRLWLDSMICGLSTQVILS